MASKNRKRTFFDEDTEHGLVKRIMLKKYLQAYIAKTQNEKFTLRTILIDGFAGVGRYGNEWPSEIEKYGSPLIALMIALGFCYKEDMKKKKKPAEEQGRSKNGKEQVVSEESGVQERSVKSGIQKGLEENEMQERPVESGMQEGLEGNEMQEIPEDSGMRAREITAASKVQGMLEKKENHNGQEENETQGTSTGVQLLESSEIEKKKQSVRESLWGWQASDMDPEAQLEYELKQWNNRKEFCKQLAKMSFIFIENDPKNFSKLSANVELLIIYFLKRLYPSLKYGWRTTMKNDTVHVQLDLDTDPFFISVEIVKGKFADINPPLMLTDKSVRSLTFLDPFGFTQTPMSHIAKFAPGSGNEVFIIFMSSFVNRFVSRSTKGVVELYGIDPPDFENEDDLSDFVKYVIHFCKPEKEHIFSNKINKCASIYEGFLKRKTNSKYSLTFEVKDKGNTTLYHMIHITNHIRGVEAMKESMNRCSQREGEMIMSEYDIVRKGLKLNLENLDDPVKVAITIFNKYRGKKRVPMADIQEYILFDTNYLFRKNPLIKLQKAGKITDVIDTKGNRQKIEYRFPCKDFKTKKPIFWLISFADEECTAEQISVDTAEAEKLRKREEREETAKKKKEQKQKRQTEKREQKEKRLKETDERKKKKEEERLVKERKKEDRRRKIEESKQKRDEARKLKAELSKRKDRKSDNEMRSQTVMTTFFRLDTNKSLGQIQINSADKISAEVVPMEIDNALGTNETDNRGLPVVEEASGSGVQKGMKRGKENGRKDKTQRRISGTFMSKKQTQLPLTGTAAEQKSFKTRKRKMSEIDSNTEEPAKRTVDTSGRVYPSSDNMLDSNERISNNSETDKKHVQKKLTQFFQRK